MSMRVVLEAMVVLLLGILLIGCGGQLATLQPTAPPTVVMPQIPIEAQLAIDELQQLAHEFPRSVDALECPAEHPDIVAMGELTGMVFNARQEIESFHIHVRWNCAKGEYEIVDATQDSLCNCLPTTP